MTASRFSSICSSWKVLLKERWAHPLTFKYWEACEQVDTLSRDALLAIQSESLACLLENAARYVPYYRDWAREGGYDLNSLPAIGEWPVLTKAPIRHNIESFQADHADPSVMIASRTSGSSGEPFTLRVHPSSTDYSYACFWRSVSRHGVFPGERCAYIWGRSFEFNASSPRRNLALGRLKLRDWMSNKLSLNAYDLQLSHVDDVIDKIRAFKPVYLHGYVSALYVIARRLDQTGQSLGDAVRLVITESEKLYDFQRDHMQQAFQCPVREHYGSVEFGNIAQEDHQGLLRTADDMFYLEQDSDDRLLVTNLRSKTFPMIRFQIGDIARPCPPPLDTQLPYGVLTDLIGRTVDLIQTESGHVHGVALAHILDPHLTQISKYQVRQLAIGEFEIKLVSKGKVSEDKILGDFQQLLGRSQVDFLYVNDIQPDPSGKFRWVVSELSQQQNVG